MDATKEPSLKKGQTKETTKTMEERLVAGWTWSLALMVVWAASSALWNAAGMILISQGKPPRGPTASWMGAVILVVMIPVLAWTSKRVPLLYVVLALLVIVGACYTIYGAITLDPSHWPSPFWRVTGAAINVVGALGALGAIGKHVKSRST